MKNNLSWLILLLTGMNAFGQLNTSTSLEKVKAEFNLQQPEKLITRLQEVNNDIVKKGIQPFAEDNQLLLTGYSYGEFYDWDLYFENIYLSYFGISEYNFTNLKAFLKRQHQNGFVSRTLKEPRPYQHFKPFLAQIAYLGSIQKNDFTWLNEVTEGAKNKGIAAGGVMNEENFVNDRSYYQRLKEYIHFWFWYQDFDKNGLPVWNSADHSGMDNQISRAGKLNTFRFEGVDLACYLYRELKALALIAAKLGYVKDEAAYNEHAAKLIKQINTAFWNEKNGFYYDRDEQTGQQAKVKAVSGFLPLFIGAASKKQAERLVKEHLLNKNEFWTPYPIPAYALTEPDYGQDVKTNGECNWRGTTWIPTNYMVFHGLLDYGYTDIAKQLAQKTFDLAFSQNSVTREYYNAETGAGKGLSPFWGWSALAYFMPFEYELKYNPTDLSNQRIIPMGSEILGISFKNVRKKYEYSVSRLAAPITVDAHWDKAQWKSVVPLQVGNYMYKLPRFKPSMEVKLAYDNDNLYVIFQVTDSAVRCVTKEINGPVWEDNAAEFFFAPDSQAPSKYFNLEINCGGVPLLHYNAVAGKEILDIPADEVKKIEIAHSYTPASDEERFGILTWTLEYKIPLSLLEKYSKVSKPAKGVTWRANFYKIAHKSSDPHYASWSLVDIAPDDVDMHRPEFSGLLNFQ